MNDNAAMTTAPSMPLCHPAARCRCVPCFAIVFATDHPPNALFPVIPRISATVAQDLDESRHVCEGGGTKGEVRVGRVGSPCPHLWHLGAFWAGQGDTSLDRVGSAC